MKLNHQRFVYLFTALLMMGGCTTVPPISIQTSQWLYHQQQLRALADWQLRGRVAIITEEKRQSANIYWSQKSDLSEMRLTGPLGSELLKLVFSSNEVTLSVDDNTYIGTQADKLLYKLTGWPIPVASLAEWLIGLPAEGSYTLNEHQQLAQVTTTDKHWQVTYANYQDIAPYILPRDLTISGTTTKIKLSINQWQITP